MKQIIFGKTNNVLNQFIRYVVVGGIATVFDMGTLYCVVSVLGINYLIGTVGGFLVGVFINYLLSHFWVFQIQANNHLKDFIIFTIIGVIGLFLTLFIMYVGVDYLGFYYIYVKIVAVIVVLFWNFFARKFIIFDKREKGKN